MKIASPSFGDGEEIPTRHAFDGDNLSPPLTIADVPASARSFALIVECLDAPIGRFTHWVVWNIPPDVQTLGEGSPPPEAERGLNGFGEVAYAGPCPPSGRYHYRVRVFALDTTLDARTPDRRDHIEREMEGHVVAEAALHGVYRAGT